MNFVIYNTITKKFKPNVPIPDNFKSIKLGNYLIAFYSPFYSQKIINGTKYLVYKNGDKLNITHAKSGEFKVKKNKIKRKKFKLSIIITAYNTQNYIEKCLKSIEEQTLNIDYEILLGIDHCHKTLEVVKSLDIKNLRIFWMKENVGTYITTNTLLKLTKYDNILRFDSDDYMSKDMFKHLYSNHKSCDILQFSFKNFGNDDTIGHLAIGCIFYKKWLLEKIGGYNSWRVSSDWDFLKRCNSLKNIVIKKFRYPLFFRRVHDTSLTLNKKTGMNSKLRKDIDKLSSERIKNGLIKIEPEISEYEELN